jgi:hypothetical protein
MDQLLVRHSAFIRYWRRHGSAVGQYGSNLSTSIKPIALLGEGKYCTSFSLNLVYHSNILEYLSDAFPIRMG